MIRRGARAPTGWPARAAVCLFVGHPSSLLAPSSLFWKCSASCREVSPAIHDVFTRAGAVRVMTKPVKTAQLLSLLDLVPQDNDGDDA